MSEQHERRRLPQLSDAEVERIADCLKAKVDAALVAEVARRVEEKAFASIGKKICVLVGTGVVAFFGARLGLDLPPPGSHG